MPRQDVYRERLRSAIDRNQVSVRALARRMDSEQPERARRNLHNWLSGVVPSPAHRAELAELLDDEALLEGEDDEESDPVALLMKALRRVVREELRSVA